MIELKESTAKAMVEQIEFVTEILDSIERNDDFKPKVLCKYGIYELNNLSDYLQEVIKVAKQLEE